jgi:hypothetical protein
MTFVCHVLISKRLQKRLHPEMCMFIRILLSIYMPEVPGGQVTQRAAPEVVADRHAVIQNGFHRHHASSGARGLLGGGEKLNYFGWCM